MEQHYNNWLNTAPPTYKTDAERKRAFLHYMQNRHSGRFFYAMPNHSLVTAKMRRKQSSPNWRKFKALFKGVEPEYFNNLMIFRG